MIVTRSNQLTIQNNKLKLNQMKTENNHASILEANTTNIESTFKKIQEYANEKGYRIEGNLKQPTNLIGLSKISFDSGRQRKTVRNYINRLDKKVNISTANKFLHFLYKKVYKMGEAPRIELSEQETKIQAARKAWKKAFAESEKLRLEYRKLKGDFYKTNKLAA